MKLRTEHYAQLRDAFSRAPAQALVDTAGDPLKRQRWDRLWAAEMPREWWNAVYDYADDSNIDTALRAITRDIALPVAEGGRK